MFTGLDSADTRVRDAVGSPAVFARGLPTCVPSVVEIGPSPRYRLYPPVNGFAWIIRLSRVVVAQRLTTPPLVTRKLRGSRAGTIAATLSCRTDSRRCTQVLASGLSRRSVRRFDRPDDVRDVDVQ